LLINNISSDTALKINHNISLNHRIVERFETLSNYKKKSKSDEKKFNDVSHH